MKNQNWFRGKKAFTQGKVFEDLVRHQAARDHILCIDMPLGMKRFGRKMCQVKTPFDMIFVRNQTACFIDCKSVDAERFSYSQIKTHQAMPLRQIEAEGFNAGYLIFFRAIDEVVFFKASTLVAITHGEGIGPDDGIKLGSQLGFTLSPLLTSRL